MTPTTTWAAIRAQMASTIRALTPVSLAGDPFLLTETEMYSFRDHADGNDLSAFREFEIEDTSHSSIGTQDLDVQMRETSCEIVVAYPNLSRVYATQDANNRYNEASQRAVIEQDANSIIKAVGVRGSANYVSGQHAALEETWSTEAGDGVTFLVIPLTVLYYYDAS